MSRKTLIRLENIPYHITVRSNNREWFDLPLSEIWEIVTNLFPKCIHKTEAKIHAFVLMSNHYHLLISTPLANIDLFMYYFNKNIGIKIREKTNRINRIFGGRYKWSIIKSNQNLALVLRYIYQNPVRAKMVIRPETYPYSSLYYLANKLVINYPFYCPFKEELPDFLKWINQDIKEEELVAISKGLKRTTFTIFANTTSRVMPTLGHFKSINSNIEK